MSPEAIIAWRDPKRWENTHLMLSLDIINPLFPYVGIPFQGEKLAQFQQLIRDYNHAVFFLDSAQARNAGLSAWQHRLLVALDNEFGAAIRNAYFHWYAEVFMYLAHEHDRGWSAWEAIFMRCSVRAGWWERLHLTPRASPLIWSYLGECKETREAARHWDSPFDLNSVSDWDKRVLGKINIDADSIRYGEPFSSFVLTSNFYNFGVFWTQLLKELSPIELDALWRGGQEIGPLLKIEPASLLHPAQLQVIPGTQA